MFNQLPEWLDKARGLYEVTYPDAPKEYLCVCKEWYNELFFSGEGDRTSYAAVDCIAKQFGCDMPFRLCHENDSDEYAHAGWGGKLLMFTTRNVRGETPAEYLINCMAGGWSPFFWRFDEGRVKRLDVADAMQLFEDEQTLFALATKHKEDEDVFYECLADTFNNGLGNLSLFVAGDPESAYLAGELNYERDGTRSIEIRCCSMADIEALFALRKGKLRRLGLAELGLKKTTMRRLKHFVANSDF